ncbi:Ubiquitin carboxyl-terminal hydrolase 21 [Vitis vinifera]|uniref:Ubiquitin carboxyl-terminal hydrolase 21 n=1 Tax=Vitis vinifera TaxID=29760 RepID=A0A438F7H3_VITVI|nr:Ubiquitin carboxyl-terminal hydrolase 21 [Vitis vinifera]
MSGLCPSVSISKSNIDEKSTTNHTSSDQNGSLLLKVIVIDLVTHFPKTLETESTPFRSLLSHHSRDGSSTSACVPVPDMKTLTGSLRSSRFEALDDQSLVPTSPMEKTLEREDENLMLFSSLSSSSTSPWSWNRETKPPFSSYLPREIEPTMVGAGLVNLSNTCFLNAVLQCFTHTVPLVQRLRSCNYAMPCHSFYGGFCVLYTFRDHIESSIASS